MWKYLLLGRLMHSCVSFVSILNENHAIQNSWLLDQQNIKWLTAFQYIHNLYLLCSTTDKPAPCKWLGLIHLLQPRICVWRLHGILYLYVLVFIMLSVHLYEIWGNCMPYWVHYNHLSNLCRKVKIMSYICEHLQCKSLYPQFIIYYNHLASTLQSPFNISLESSGF